MICVSLGPRAKLVSQQPITRVMSLSCGVGGVPCDHVDVDVVVDVDGMEDCPFTSTSTSTSSFASTVPVPQIAVTSPTRGNQP